jgi:hypothetical protein
MSQNNSVLGTILVLYNAYYFHNYSLEHKISKEMNTSPYWEILLHSTGLSAAQ